MSNADPVTVDVQNETEDDQEYEFNVIDSLNLEANVIDFSKNKEATDQYISISSDDSGSAVKSNNIDTNKYVDMTLPRQMR